MYLYGYREKRRILVISPGEEHARNKEIDLMTKKGQLNMLRIFLLISYILKKEINLTKLFLLSNHVKENNKQQYLHHISTKRPNYIRMDLREVSNIAQ